MCGIVGFVGAGDPLAAVLDGLRRLEYRGYDSAGVAAVSAEGLSVTRSVGRVEDLAARVGSGGIAPSAAVGHTRWATHGRPTEENAHPHTDASGRVAIVHNGIIENCAVLREALEAEGAVFRSDTDSEVVAHLVAKYDNGDLVDAVERTIADLEGTWALAVTTADRPDLIVGARQGSPLAAGVSADAAFLASDAIPLAPFTDRAVFLEDGDVATLRPGSLELRRDGRVVEAVETPITWNTEEAGLGAYPHWMLKEIHEQPAMLERLVRTRVLEPGESGAPGAPPRFDLDGVGWSRDFMRDIGRVVLIGQGTAFHACMIGRNMFERVVRLPVFPEYSSDFRYRDPVLDPSVLVIALTQSGETLDTLEGVRLARSRGCRTLAVTNSPGSTIARESDDVFDMDCGPEIGVASTKAFTAMIASLYILAIRLGMARETVSLAEARRRTADLLGVGPRCESVLADAGAAEDIASVYADARNCLFLGRGTGWPLAMEGALKLKEVSYIHAEGYNAAEMKHGPIALIDEEMPVVVIALRGRRYEKIVGNIREVKARGGRVVAVADRDDDAIGDMVDHVIPVRAESGIMNSILCSVPLQLFAYHVAVQRELDVDKPRNLAKSVTVE